MMNSSFFNDKSISSINEKTRAPISESPTYSLEFSGKIEIVEFSPYLWSHDLLAVALPNKLIIGQIQFKEEDDNQIEEINYSKIEEFITPFRIHSIAWSPETNINIAPKYIVLATTNSVYQIIIYGSYVANEDDNISSKIIEGHSGYVNDICYNSTCEFLASVSDDLTCKVWVAKDFYDQFCEFYLRSPGMAVCWHKDEPGKLLVGEKYGTVTMYNLSTKTTILSLRSQGSPLMSMDWSPSHSAYVAALCGGNLVVWCITSPSSPFVERMIHSDGGQKIKFFPLSESKLVTLGAHDNSLKVYQANPPSPFPVCLTSTLKMASGLTCHQHLPYVCTASDNFVYMWRLNF